MRRCDPADPAVVKARRPAGLPAGRAAAVLSESARATAAAESRFRVAAPNSSPRSVKVVALDRSSESMLTRLALRRWNNAAFFTAAAFGTGPIPDDTAGPAGWLRDLDGRARDLIDEVANADLVVLAATAGRDAPAAAVIGELCRLSGVMTTALVVGEHSADNDAGSGSDSDSDADALARTLAQLRPHSAMVVATPSTDYVGDMLTALRA